MFPADFQSEKADVDGRTHPEEMVKRTIQPNATRNPKFSFDPEKHITIKNTVGTVTCFGNSLITLYQY